eukprot:scaffold2527_cov241-Pinguiococcus_pyrenoidosus.AAC.3
MDGTARVGWKLELTRLPASQRSPLLALGAWMGLAPAQPLLAPPQTHPWRSWSRFTGRRSTNWPGAMSFVAVEDSRTPKCEEWPSRNDT